MSLLAPGHALTQCQATNYPQSCSWGADQGTVGGVVLFYAFCLGVLVLVLLGIVAWLALSGAAPAERPTILMAFAAVIAALLGKR